MFSRLNLGARLDSVTVGVHDRLFVGKRRVWVTGVIVALLTWQVRIALPAPSLDESWKAGLYMALQHGKDFGSEIVFTYGPLGFLSWPGLWVGLLGTLAFLFLSLVFVSFSVTLIAALERSTNLTAAAVVTFLFLATLPNLEQVPLMLAVGFCFFALRADPPEWGIGLLAIGGGTISALECLIKLSSGPTIFLICALGMIGARAERRHWAMFATCSIGGLIFLWLIAGQSLGALGDYVANGAQVITGYNEAMGIDEAPTWGAVTLVIGAIALVGMTALAPFKDRRARWFAVVAVAVAAFSTYKYGIVRFETGHLALALTAVLGIWLQLPWPKVRAMAFLVTSAILGVIFTHSYPTPMRLDVISNVNTLRESAELVVRPGERKLKTDQGRAAMQATYNVDPTILAAMRGKSVAIEPWEIGVAWAYGLDWSPLPVIQNYSAYTRKLDNLNAEALRDPKGPEVILRPNPGYSAWEPPGQAVAAVCNFESIRLVSPWQLLKRVPNRCGVPKLISNVEGRVGEDISVPQAHRRQMIILKIGGAEIEGLERLESLLWKPSARTAVINGDQVTGHLAPGTTGDGFIVSRDPSLDGPPGFEQLPQIDRIRIEGVDRSLEFRFYRIEIRPGPPRQ